MRKTLCVSVLLLTLCGSVLAGDIPNPPIAPPSSSANAAQGQTANGWISTGASARPTDDIIPGDNADSLVSAALTVLNSVLALF